MVVIGVFVGLIIVIVVLIIVIMIQQNVFSIVRFMVNQVVLTIVA